MKRMILVFVAVFLIAAAGMFMITNSAKNLETGRSYDKIVLFMDGDSDGRNYCSTLYEAMKKIEESQDITVEYFDNVPAGEFSSLALNMIAQGFNIIIASSEIYESDMMKLAEDYPEVYFMNAAGTESAVNYASFFGRTYQARYLTGVVAGLQTTSNEIGYISSTPDPESIRQLNAFTTGVRKINPNAFVYVKYSGEKNNDEADRQATLELLNDHDIDVLTRHTSGVAPLEVADEKGIFTIGCNHDDSDIFPDTFLTACVYDWEKFLTERISECGRGKFNGKHYWEGLKDGVVSISPLTGNVRFGTGEIVGSELNRILDGRFDVFYGPVTDNYGSVRVYEGENLSDAQLLNNMYWYVEGVVVE